MCVKDSRDRLRGLCNCLSNPTDLQLIHLRKDWRQPIKPKDLQSILFVRKKKIAKKINDTQKGMLFGIPKSASCVQRFDDSLNSAIHITYRNSLRSSSMGEPRDPLSKVFFSYIVVGLESTLTFIY
jgi:hypothetical protein